MTPKQPPSFGRAGRPRRIRYSDLFLWHPQIENEIAGTSITEVFGEEYPEMLSLWRDMGRGRKISQERLSAVLPAALEHLGCPLTDDIRKALKGEDSVLQGVGLWEAYVSSLSMKPGSTWPPKLSPLGQHVVKLERALVEPTLAWRDSDFARCADLIDAAPVLSGHLWPKVIEQIRNATTKQEVEYARLLVALEIRLSCLACSDAILQAKHLTATPTVELLIPNFDTDNAAHPNALFFEWLDIYTEMDGQLATKIDQISKTAADSDIGSSRRQLRRWKSGKAFPSDHVLQALFCNLFGNPPRENGDPSRRHWELCWSMARACRQIGFLMPIMVGLSAIQEPIFPFGHASVQKWRESRYRHWYKHWLPLLDAN